MVKQLQVIILKNEVFANNHNGFDAIFRVTGEFEEVLWERKGEMFSFENWPLLLQSVTELS